MQQQPEKFTPKAIVLSQDILGGFAATIPPLFVAGLLYAAPINQLAGHEKMGLLSASALVGLAKAIIENYKREHPEELPHQYPLPVKIIEVALSTFDGFAAFVIPFLFLGLHEDLRPTVQAFHLPILIASSIYALINSVKSAANVASFQGLDDPEPRPLFPKENEDPEGFISDMKCLIDYLNNTVFSGCFQVAPIAFVLHDFFNAFTAPTAVGLASTTAAAALARFAVFYYQRSNPTVLAKDYPSWVKTIELLSTASTNFGIAAIPSLVVNALFGMDEAAKIICTATAVTYSAITTIKKSDDLGLPIYNPAVSERNESSSYWSSVKKAAGDCYASLPSWRKSPSTKSLLSDDPLLENNLLSDFENPLFDRARQRKEDAGCWSNMKKAGEYFCSFFPLCSNASDSSSESLLLNKQDGTTIQRREYVSIV